jgi:tetratricopeptide (TPR) repeat protein
MTETRTVRALDRGAWALLEAGRVREAMLQWGAVNGALRRAGQWDEARAVARTMVSVASQHNVGMQLCGIYSMAETAREAGELADAEGWIRRALAIHRELEEPRGVACDLAALGELAEDSGDLERAVEAWSQALALLDAERSAEAVHDLLLGLGRVYTGLGNEVLAATCAARAEQLAARWAE